MTSKVPSRGRRTLVSAGAVVIMFLVPASRLQAAPDPYLIEVKKLIASDGKANDEFGLSAAISGNTAVVGEFPHNGIPASAYLYQEIAQTAVPA